MKFTQIAIFAILTIAATVTAQAQANCAGTTSTWCLSCVGTSCNQCAMGFSDPTTTKCTAPTTAVTGCAAYSNATTCSACNPGLLLISNACSAPSTLITGCYSYRGTAITDANRFCTSCNADLYPGGATDTSFTTAGGDTTIVSCNSAKPAQNTGTAADLITGCANHYPSQVSAANGTWAWGCRWCKSTHYKVSETSCVSGATDNVGCAVGTGANACTVCHVTHQMTEPNKCTVKPGSTYSAILSVVSMIVALMFANF